MKRILTFLALTLSMVIGALVGCSSDPDSPVGSALVDDDLIRSRPGDLFVDTLLVTASETSFVTNALLAQAQTMEVGRRDSIGRTALLRFDFSSPGDDTLRVVERAEIVLQALVDDGVEMQVQFYELSEPFTESDTLTSLGLEATPLTDPDTGSGDRLLVKNPINDYRLDPALVQEWIRGTKTHNGIAFVETEGSTDKVFDFATKESSGTTDPFLRVVFAGGDPSNYAIVADGTFVEDDNTTPSPAIADGETRRIHFPIDLSAFSTELLLHNAELVFHVDTTKVIGGDLNVSLYRPTSSTPPGLLDGDDVGFIDLKPTPEIITPFRFNVRAELEAFLADPSTNHGFVLRFTLEGANPRRLGIYGSAAPDSLKPSLRLIYSEAADFPHS